MERLILEYTREHSEINRSVEAKRLIEKWARTGLLKNLESVHKTNMARLLENEAIALRKLNEGSTTTDVAGFNKIAFPLVRRVFAQLISNELVSVQPMSLPSGLLFYLDFRSDRTKSGWTNGGSLYGDIAGGGTHRNKKLIGIGEQSTSGGFYNLNTGYSQRLFQLTKGVSAVFMSEFSDNAGKQSITASSAAISGTLTAHDFPLAHTTTSVSSLVDLSALHNIRPAVSGELQYENSTHGTNNFRTLSAVKSLSGDRFRDNIDPNLTTLLIGNVGNGASAISDQTNVAIRIFSNTPLTTATSASGSLTGTTEEVVLVGPLSTQVDDLTPSTTLGDFEATSAIPEILISVSSVPVTAQTRKLKAVWTPELAQDLNAYHALDAEVELTTILAEQIATEIDREILVDLLHCAPVKAAWSRKIGRYVTLASDGVTVSTNNLNANVSNTTNQAFFGTQRDWYETLIETITVVSNEIFKRNLRGGANWIVTSPEISAVLESTLAFKPSLTLDPAEVQYALGVQRIGTVQNRYTIYKDPYFPADYVLMGYKGSSFLETGYVYAPYVPLVVTPTIFEPNDFTPRKGVMTRYAKQVVRPEFYGIVRVIDLDWIGSPASA